MHDFIWTVSQKQFKLSSEEVLLYQRIQWPSNLLFLFSSFLLFTLSWEQWREQHKSSVQPHPHLLTKQLRESNILQGLLLAALFSLPPSSPRTSSFIHPSLTNGAGVNLVWDLSGLVRVWHLHRDIIELWWSFLTGERRRERRKREKPMIIPRELSVYTNSSSCFSFSLWFSLMALFFAVRYQPGSCQQ